MILDARNPDTAPNEVAADVVIVGAGTMGLFLARCLAEADRRIVLVEAGGRVAGTTQNGEIAGSCGKTNYGVTLGRARGLGGTSLLWGGQLVEFEESDLGEQRPRWPIPFSELRRWYDVIYDELGIGKPLPDAEYRRRFGGEASAHPDIERFFTVWLPQPNFARLFRQEITVNPRIHVFLNATVHDIVFEGARARAVRAIAEGGRRLIFRGSDFVFASGTIETSRFFLSTQRRSEVPWKSSRNIGAYFHDHLGGRIGGVRVLNERKFREFFENGVFEGVKVQPKLRFTTEARRRTATGVCGLFAFSSSVSENLERIKEVARGIRAGTEFSRLATVLGDLFALGRSFAPLIVRYVRDKRVMAFFDKANDLHVQAEQRPIASSRLFLTSDEVLEDGLERVTLDWRLDGCEIEAVRHFARDADAYLQEHDIARLDVDAAVRDGDPAFLDTLNDTYHQCGGMLMASAERDGVVDTDCRVFGTDNVYVAGAAVFPTSGHANSTLTALALTARLAGRIKA